MDLLAGHLDGITWRVTLDSDGEPLIADAMHNCGCYHMAFPGSHLGAKTRSGRWEEPLLAPQRLAARDGVGGRYVIRVEAKTHYLQRVYLTPEQAHGIAYALTPYNALRRLLKVDGGRESAFSPNGLLLGTQRAERWLFWPMGVLSPGAMRQRGHHPVAFIGERHFDDPNLISRHFSRTSP